MSAGVCAGALVAIGARPDEAQDALHDAFEKALARNEHFSLPEGWLFVVASRLWRQHRVPAVILSPPSLLAKSVVVADADRVEVLFLSATLPSPHPHRPFVTGVSFQRFQVDAQLAVEDVDSLTVDLVLDKRGRDEAVPPVNPVDVQLVLREAA